MNTTKKAQHTAGEWAWNPHSEAIEANGRPIALLADAFLYPYPNQEANARLISASPELLSACEHTLNVINGRIQLKALCPDDGVLGIIKELENAIAKARGE